MQEEQIKFQNEQFQKMSKPPSQALHSIGFGALKGKSDINPQWRIEIMTQTFGLCGVGWKYEITDQQSVKLDDGRIMIFMTVAAYTKQDEGWSAPVYGCGGDFIVDKNKNGFAPNDEAWKMCLTDALGNALVKLGVASDIYRGLWDGSKYVKREEEEKQNKEEEKQNKNGTNTKTQNTQSTNNVQWVRKNGECYEAFVADKWFKVDMNLNKKQLNYLANNPQYSMIHDIVKAFLSRIN